MSILLRIPTRKICRFLLKVKFRDFCLQKGDFYDIFGLIPIKEISKYQVQLWQTIYRFKYRFFRKLFRAFFFIESHVFPIMT